MLQKFTPIDLTHELSDKMVSWTGGCGFRAEIKGDYDDAAEGEPGFRVQQIKMHGGIGTHIDAPIHCVRNGKSVAQLSLENLISHCVMIDLSSQANETFSANHHDIITFEKKYGSIPANSFVIFYNGWEKYWSTPEQYRNHYYFPSIGRDAIELLLERDIAGVGIDTLSPDRPSDGFPVHELMLGAGKYIVENVANANRLPVMGSYSFALPIKFSGGSEAPMRLIALIPY
ncbi:MAG: cyclase family protein [Gammaproteobacteria bacterium]|nr:cyclase family protein [Gammaproteobacteria bacterium]